MSLRRDPVVVVAPDSFKGSMAAADAAGAIARGVRAALPGATIVELPMADGGEGTLDAILAAWNRAPRSLETSDALGRPRTARYGLSADGTTCLIEAAEANGLPHVSDVDLQPLRADSTGVGVIAAAALDAGVDEILLCIGGSASSDGGSGLLTALGARFLDADGHDVERGAAGLADIRTVDASGLHPAARTTRWRVAVDVDNPLVGPHGAAATFGPQKGATPDDAAIIDAGLENFAQVLADVADADSEVLLTTPGFGAAGGLPLALVTLLNAELLSGSELVGSAVGLEPALARADLVLTGEGSFDEQSLRGKVVDAIRRAAPVETPVVVLAGTVKLDAARCHAEGITAAISIARGPQPLSVLVDEGPALLEDAAAHVCRLLAVASAPPRRISEQQKSAST